MRGLSSTGRNGRGIPMLSVSAEINVTPLIDVLLVLLVTFMVLQAGLLRGLSVQVPPPDPSAVPGPDRLVLEVEPGGRYLLNRHPVPAAFLETHLARVFEGRPRKVLFVKGAEGLTYGEVMRAVDASRLAGVQVVGLVPRAS